MNEHEIDVSLERARQQLRAGNPEAAIETLRRVLSLAPEHARAHAMLAWVLIDRRRLHAAELEAGHALLEDPELPLAHFVMAQVAMARRDLDRARTHLDQLLELEPHDADNHVAMAHYHELRGQWDEARASLDHALELEPDEPDILVALGQLLYQLGRVDQAAERCEAALELDPEHLGAHRLRGWLDLHAGNLQEARGHACFVLAHDPADEPALTLLVAIMARKSIWLGSWWRLSTWLGQLEDQRRMAVLLGSFVVYQVLTIVARALGRPEVAEALQWAWLGVCAYTWVAPLVFRRLLAKELGQVRLRPDY
jgi:Tfp pilus assembly protein PilF